MKIITALNAMIQNPELISSVLKGFESDELFFLYNKKHKWSISQLDNGSAYSVFYYPTATPLNVMAGWDHDEWADFSEMVRYSSKEIGSREARDTFAELYRTVKEQQYGINEVLDDIISTGSPF